VPEWASELVLASELVKASAWPWALESVLA
jgi:hypothetical protein